MKFWPLLWSNLKRRKARTIFTLLSIVVAFILFAYLAAVRIAFSAGVEVAGADRLFTTHKTSIIQPLPKSYQDQIARTPGVVSVTHASWFGGIYQNPNTGFQGVFQAPVEPESYLAMYPEFKVTVAEKKAWADDREGVLVGETTARRYGWKVGDRVPVQGTIWRKKDGSKVWEFNVRGIYTGDKTVDKTQFLFHYDYFDEARQYGQGIVGWYIVRIADPKQAADIGKKIDANFANSPAETKTVTEKALAQGFADQIGNIGAIIQWILAAVFFTLLLVTGNTIAQSVRERTAELAVLKTVGFSNGAVLALVLVEALVLTIVGGGLGLAIGAAAIAAGDPTHGFLPIFYLPSRDAIVGILFVVLLGLVAGILPAVQAMRLRIVDALRRA
ncbi:MAG TPA: FtsX-like permease family protein [Candidatus Polarisedimenticolaceae bacterium]|nr:FtsX-like permease family protein [Candidatus Polarisedimenticolaceae bacterium]